jgi:hypothetical protein
MLLLAIGLVLWSLQPLTAQEEQQEPPGHRRQKRPLQRPPYRG